MMRPSLTLAGASVVLAALASAAAAQTEPTVATFGSLLLRINIDDTVVVEDARGVRATGRVREVTAHDLTIENATGERRVAREAVRVVAVRRSPIRQSVLTGAALGAGYFAATNCFGSDRRECGDALILGAALGSGLGLVAGALAHRTATVFQPADAQTPDGEFVGVAFDGIARRVNLDDRIRIKTSTGVVSGRLARLAADAIVIETDAGPRRFAAQEILSIGLRGHSPGRGALIGGATFAVLGIVSCLQINPPGGCAAVSPITVLLGASLGAAIAELVPTTITVYRAVETHLALAPVLSRHMAAFQLGVTW